jgi:hypothetical protein
VENRADRKAPGWIEVVPQVLDPPAKIVLAAFIRCLIEKKKQTATRLEVSIMVNRILGERGQEPPSRTNEWIWRNLKKMKEMDILALVNKREGRYKLMVDLESLVEVLKKDPELSSLL